MIKTLKQKYAFFNILGVIFCMSAITLVFYVGNRGFGNLVNVSAKNLTSLYTSGELKSLLWQEMLDYNSLAGRRGDPEKLRHSVEKVNQLTQTLLDHSSVNQRSMIVSFAETHQQILSLTPGSFALEKSTELYTQAFKILTDFGDDVLVNSQEQQGEIIFQSNNVMKFSLLAAIFLTSGILLFSFLYFRKNVINAILYLSKASLDAGLGVFQPIVLEQTQDEIGTLAKNFNEMIEKIRISSEAIRKERDNAQEANQAKSIFLANMSHEIRTPMHGILSFCRFGVEKYQTATREDLKSFFEEISDSGDRLMMLLNDLLDLSKLESGKIDYHFEENDLVDLIKMVIHELQAFADQHRVKLSFDHRGLGAIAYFDSARIMQVVRNLLSNAIKFSNTDTTVQIFLDGSNDRLTCAVANQGIGIPASELESVFDKFVQSSRTRKSSGGTGLGLAICKEIISQHHGKIWALSESGGETRFTFEIPSQEMKGLVQG